MLKYGNMATNNNDILFIPLIFAAIFQKNNIFFKKKNIYIYFFISIYLFFI